MAIDFDFTKIKVDTNVKMPNAEDKRKKVASSTIVAKRMRKGHSIVVPTKKLADVMRTALRTVGKSSSMRVQDDGSYRVWCNGRLKGRVTKKAKQVASAQELRRKLEAEGAKYERRLSEDDLNILQRAIHGGIGRQSFIRDLP